MYFKKEFITSTYFKKVSDDTKEEYAERVNEWYISFARSKNVKETDIAINIPYLVRDLLNAKLLMEYAVDHIEPSLNGAPSFYELQYITAKSSYNNVVKNISSSVIKGVINEGTTTSVFGTRVR